jgi:hypothetical protein
MPKVLYAKDESQPGKTKIKWERPAKERVKVTLPPLAQGLGNGAVQRLLAQRSGTRPTELDDALADSINKARGGGRALDAGIQKKMSDGLGADFNGVRVHTDKEADSLNQQLNARAFATGQDVFFREGEYNPHSSSGQELIAHELTHVAQQSSGAVQGSGRMSVNAPGDRYEQEADAVAHSVGSLTTAPAQAQSVQLQTVPEEEEAVQAQAVPEQEEETLAQMQELPEEEEVGTT